MAVTHLFGELAGTVTALQLPNIPCSRARFKAASDNTGSVYIGGAGVTLPDGTTDTTTGFELDAGDDSGWFPCANLNELYRNCTGTGDKIMYWAQL